ncbi:hypothetical protein OG762_08550 [Streptomyces sp. NBC_01136]|uniref:hypothetical protein n=1 Tax=unclassified Streptomyces TaxID=2593676 RepID=UPI00325281D3|nr:hypothetical protein OG762_08550 [Streptomyces sp. NBC_01136]
MQQSVVPELAHTHTRPIHWLATATALAGVVALSSVIQPGSATAAQPGPEAKSAPAATTAPDPAGVTFPIECGPTKVLIQKTASGDLDGDGSPETVAVVRCDAGSGTPPNGVYVLTQGEGAKKPRVVATLVDPKDRLSVTDFAVRDSAVTATLLGYSSADVPSCCPDVKDQAKWQWKNGTFIRSTPADAQNV